MPPTESEKGAAISELESPEERAEREAAGIGKPRRGRPPGSSNKPKLSDEALLLGCKQLVSLLWLLASFPAYLTNHKLSALTDAEKNEGAEQARALVLRFGWLAILLSVIGFPLWMIQKIFEHAEKLLPKPGKKNAPVLSITKSADENAPHEKTPDTDEPHSYV